MEKKRKRFFDLRIIFMLHYSNEFLKQVLNFYFNLGDILSKYGRIMKSSFIGTVVIIFF